MNPRLLELYNQALPGADAVDDRGAIADRPG